MPYNSGSYSIRTSGLSETTPTHSYGPPGVEMDSESFYAALKRTSSESLYHQTLLDAYTKQAEAWYSANPLTKRPRYESTSHLPIYPQRPGEKDCTFYMQTRTCKFGDSCIFDHPIWVPEGGIPDWKEVPPVPSELLPERLGAPDCPFFLKTQRCKFGTRCRFNHPKDKFASDNGDSSALPERPSEPPCAYYMKTGMCKFGGTCKFNHPKGVHIQSAGVGNEVQSKAHGDAVPASLHNTKGLPIRPGEEDCPFYLKTGSCKYGITCRYNHPERYAINPPAVAIGSTLLTTPQTQFNLGVVSPAASLLQTFDPLLGTAPAVYPQRPGQPECEFYMKTGICKFGVTCKFHHPIDRSSASALTNDTELTPTGLPRREGAIQCPYYMKTGTCKFGPTCKFDHPPPGEVAALSGGEEQE